MPLYGISGKGLFDDAFYRIRTVRHGLHALRQVFQTFQRGRARNGGIADGFAYGRIEFRRQRGFQTNHHFTFFAHFAGDFYAVGSVRVDEFLVLLVNLLDGGEAVGVGGFAR